jgi:hypothetical protein
VFCTHSAVQGTRFAEFVFTRSEPFGSNESIWIVNADGSGLMQVTDGTDDNPVWGPPPSTT